MKSTSNFEASFLGKVDFNKSVQLQNDLLELSKKTKSNYVIGLEHPAVLTLGYRAEIDKEILNPQEIPIERITRGGLATIHSEGQLVIYPVLNLRDLQIGVREYVLLLLETTRELLNTFGVDAFIDEKAIGLYTQTGKIAFCGVQVKNGISQHGLSLNVRNDLLLFKNIRSCGTHGQKLDSLQNYDINMTLPELFDLWITIFLGNFDFNLLTRKRNRT